MKKIKWFAGMAMAIGMGLTGTKALSAAEPYRDRQDIRSDYRDMARDHVRIDRLRAEIASDRARLNDDLRDRRYWAVSRDRAELARDRRALDALLRDVRADRADVRHDGYAYSYRGR